MLKFPNPQKVFEIGSVKIGGQPGENPPVLIGSIFYHGHKIIKNKETGSFDKKKGEVLVNKQEEFSDKTKIPCMIDLVGESEQAIIQYIDWVSNITDTPLLIDSPNPNVKIAGIRHAAEIGIGDNVIYNSLLPESKQAEYDAIKDIQLESAVLLAFQSGFMNSNDRVNVIRELNKKAENLGIKKPIVDTFVIDVPTLSIASKAAIKIKIEMGLPCGCGAHNAIATWSGFKKRMGAQALTPCTTVVNSMPIILGADFVFYGPIKSCETSFPAASTIYNSYRYLRKTRDTLQINP